MTRSSIRRASVVLLFVSVGIIAALFAKRGDDVVARVKNIAGQVVRDYRDNENAWQAAHIEDELSFGDALRTGDKATASVVLADGSALGLEPDTTVRFMADAQQAGRFRVDTGLAVFESTGAGASIATSTGLVRIDPRSRVRIVADENGLHMEVSFGRASFIDADQASQSLLPGDELVMKRGEKQPTVLKAENKGPAPGDDLASKKLLASAGNTIDTDLYGDAAPEPAAPEPEPAPVLAVERASFTNPWTREMYLAELDHQGVAFFYVARDAGRRIVGFCSFWRVLDELHINNLAVLPECRRLGVASALLARVLEVGAGMGSRRATLEVRHSNDAARRLYGGFGFVVAGVRRGYYTNPIEDALVLCRDEPVPSRP